jgi:hypothetical protein
MPDIDDQGEQVRTMERTAERRFTMAGVFAPLAGSLRVMGAGALRAASLARPCGARLAGAVLATSAAVLVLAGPAFAGAASFGELAGEGVGATRAFIQAPVVDLEGNLELKEIRVELTTEPANPASWVSVPFFAPNGEELSQRQINLVLGENDGFDGFGENDAGTGRELHHLKPDTTYYARFTVKTASGELVEHTYEFTTTAAAAPEVVIKVAGGLFNSFALDTYSLSPTSAAFNAHVETNGAKTEYHFEYTTKPENAGSWKPFTSDASGSVTVAEDYANLEAKLTGLDPETTYYVRLEASNEHGAVTDTKFDQEPEYGSFTTPTLKPVVIDRPQVRNVTGSAAYLTGSFVPHGFKSGWRFEYAMSASGPWSPVPGAAGTVTQAQAEALPNGDHISVEGRLSGLKSASTYYVRLFAENQAGEGENCSGPGAGQEVCEPIVTAAHPQIASLQTSGAPTATAYAVHALHGGSVRLLGSVNPESAPTSEEQTVTLEGAPTGGAFTLTFEGQTTGPIAFDAPAEGPGSVRSALDALSTVDAGGGSVSVGGPAGGPYAVYFGSEAEGDPLAGKSQPLLVADGSGLIPAGGAAVAVTQAGGEGVQAAYSFQYVSEAQFKQGGWAAAASTAQVALGSGEIAQFVGADLPALVPGETYRYRVVAHSDLGAVESGEQSLSAPATVPVEELGSCPNEAFRVGLSAALPDCRAYEQITPRDKEGALEVFKYGTPSFNGGTLSGVDGEHLMVRGLATHWGSGPDTAQSPYFFSRTSSGWDMTAASLQPEAGIDRYTPEVYSPDLGDFAFSASWQTSSLAVSEDVQFRVGAPGGPYATVATVPRKQVGEDNDGGWVAASADFSKLVLAVEDRGLLNLEEPTPTRSGTDLYEYVGGVLRQANVDSEGRTIGTCGARMVKGSEAVGEHASANALSADGSRLFFEAVPGHNCSEASHLYMRVGGTETVDIGAYAFLAATAEGSKLLLQRETSGAYEVFLYEAGSTAPALLFTSGQDLRSASLKPSADLDAFYFSSEESLTPEAPATVGAVTADLYRYDVASRTLSFVFQFEHFPGESVSPNGRYYYFDAREVLGFHPDGTEPARKFGFDAGKSSPQLWRYDNSEGTVECISCSSFDPEPRFEAETVESGGSDDIHALDANGLPQPLFATPNGNYAFFETISALLPQDTNGEKPKEFFEELAHEGKVAERQGGSPSLDIYEWRRDGLDGCALIQGCLALITPGSLDGYQVILLGVDESGRDVFFSTHSQLVPSDGDSAGDIYDARIDGGFPERAHPVECEGDACSTPASPPLDATPSSFTFSGAGDLAPPVVKPIGTERKPKKSGKSKKGRRKAARGKRRVRAIDGRRAGRRSRSGRSGS